MSPVAFFLVIFCGVIIAGLVIGGIYQTIRIRKVRKYYDGRGYPPDVDTGPF